MLIRQIKPTVLPARALTDQLKHEIYAVGTPVRQVSSECGLSVDALRSVLQGNKVEESTVARLEAYMKALARHEFHASRLARLQERDRMDKWDRRYYAYDKELYRVYKEQTMKLENFKKKPKREKLTLLNEYDYKAKRYLLNANKPFIDQHRIWFPDGWTYWRWKGFLEEKRLKFGAKAP